VSVNRIAIIAHLEKLGENQVRLLLSTGRFPVAQHWVIYEWLATKDQEAERLREASQAEQAANARFASNAAERASAAAERQATAAERANTSANIALVIAIISIIATIIGISIVHRDAILSHVGTVSIRTFSSYSTDMPLPIHCKIHDWL
jgi:hypothetical protein